MKLKTKWFVPPSLESTYMIIDLVLVFYRILRLCSSSWRLLQNIFFIVTSQLQVHTEFFVYILKISFHTLFVTWWFSFVSLFGNSSPLFLFSFISLNFFFLSFSAILQTEFFANVVTGLDTSVKHNLLGYIHNCNLWPGKEPSVPISLQTPVCT